MTAPEFPAAPPRQSQGRIPPRLHDAYKAYVVQHYRRFLLAINFIAMAAYDSYVLADALLIPDMAKESLLLRSGLSLIGLLNIFLVFRFSRSVLVMDMLMPVHDIISTVAWFELLKRSASPDVPFFLYASVVFILLGNLGVRYSFKGIAVVSAIISAIILYNVWLIHDGATKPLLIFTLVYLPSRCSACSSAGPTSRACARHSSPISRSAASARSSPPSTCACRSWPPPTVSPAWATAVRWTCNSMKAGTACAPTDAPSPC